MPFIRILLVRCTESDVSQQFQKYDWAFNRIQVCSEHARPAASVSGWTPVGASPDSEEPSTVNAPWSGIRIDQSPAQNTGWRAGDFMMDSSGSEEGALDCWIHSVGIPQSRAPRQDACLEGMCRRTSPHIQSVLKAPQNLHHE